MAWLTSFCDSGVLTARPPFLDAIEELFDAEDRVEFAQACVDAISDGAWEQTAAAVGLASSADVNHFWADWDAPAVIAGFDNALRKVIATGYPMKVVGLVGESYDVVSRIDGTAGRVVVTVWAPESKVG